MLCSHSVETLQKKYSVEMIRMRFGFWWGRRLSLCCNVHSDEIRLQCLFSPVHSFVNLLHALQERREPRLTHEARFDGGYLGCAQPNKCYAESVGSVLLRRSR